MEKELGKDIPISGRRDFLRDNSDQVVNMGYMRRLTHEELTKKKEELMVTAIKVSDIEEEKKAANEDFKLLLKPLKEEKKKLIRFLKEKGEWVPDEICYKFIFEEENMVGFYNGQGDLIESRPMTGEEAQASLFRVDRKTGTDNK